MIFLNTQHHNENQKLLLTAIWQKKNSYFAESYSIEEGGNQALSL